VVKMRQLRHRIPLIKMIKGKQVRFLAQYFSFGELNALLHKYLKFASYSEK
jgi:hypothetical protein